MVSIDKSIPHTVNDLMVALEGAGYLATKGQATALFLALNLRKPLLLEGFAGCGKTELARTLAPLLSTELIRLQCYEGIDTHEALYDWDYARQLLQLRVSQERGNDVALKDELYSEEYLLERPLLRALRQDKSPVLLLDELDRADADFEAFLLELLEEFQITIPEIGTVKAEHAPIVIITSNRTRDLHDALKRRCVYHWVDLPNAETEQKIIRARLPQVDQKIAQQVATAIARIRELELVKHPGTSEAVDWARALMILGNGKLPTDDDFRSTLSVVLKDHSDKTQVEDAIGNFLQPDD